MSCGIEETHCHPGNTRFIRITDTIMICIVPDRFAESGWFGTWHEHSGIYGLIMFPGRKRDYPGPAGGSVRVTV